MEIVVPKNRKYLREIIINVIILFFSVFSMDLVFFPIKPRMIIISIVLLVWIYNKISTLSKKRLVIRKETLFWGISTGLILVYTIIIAILNHAINSETAISSSFNFFIFTFVYPILLLIIFKNDIIFAKSMTYATLLHSLIVIASFATSTVREYLETIQYMEFWRYNYRIIGLGLAGAGGSVYLVSGYLCSLYILMFSDDKMKAKFSLISFIILFAIALVGRTGFYLAAVLTLYWFFYNSKEFGTWINQRFKALSVFVLISVGAIFVLNYFEINTTLFEYTSSRLLEVFRGNETLEKINNMSDSLPPIGENFFGTGIIRGQTVHGYNIQHDGGYAKRYASIGVLGFIIFYLSYVIYNLRITKGLTKSKKKYLRFALLMLLIIEYKEPFINMLAYPFVVIMLAKLAGENN